MREGADMKKGLMAAGVLWLIDLVVTAVLVSLMPDQVPVHFNGGEVDRIGSRFENFTVPVIALVLGALLALLAKYGDEGNRATMTKLGIGMQMLFIALSAFVCLNILSYDPAEISLGAPDTAVSKIGAIIIGVPVGFVNVIESKENIFAVCEKHHVPAIVAFGRKGGSTIAAAVCNALIYSAAEMLDPTARGWK